MTFRSESCPSIHDSAARLVPQQWATVRLRGRGLLTQFCPLGNDAMFNKISIRGTAIPGGGDSRF
jgi:hypothetical protein